MTEERLKIIKAAGCAYCMELIDWTERLDHPKPLVDDYNYEHDKRREFQKENEILREKVLEFRKKITELANDRNILRVLLRDLYTQVDDKTAARIDAALGEK